MAVRMVVCVCVYYCCFTVLPGHISVALLLRN